MSGREISAAIFRSASATVFVECESKAHGGPLASPAANESLSLDRPAGRRYDPRILQDSDTTT